MLKTKIWAAKALLPEGWFNDVLLTINENGKISKVAKNKPHTSESYKVGALLPAPTNCHSHVFQRAMAGLAEKRGFGKNSFWSWRKLMYEFLSKLTPEHVEDIAAFVQMEMLEAGYTACVEFHYLHHQNGGRPYENVAEMAERIVKAASLTGIGITLLPVHYQYGGCDKRVLEEGQLRFGNHLDGFVTLWDELAKAVKKLLPPDCKTGVALHSLRAVGLEDIQPLQKLSKGQPLHMHLAEQQAEVDEVLSATGLRPVEWVLQHMKLSEQCCFIHCTKMLPHETKKLASSGAIAGICPITESNLGDGMFDGEAWLENNGSIAIGSDSNVRISLVEELRTLEYSQRLRNNARAVLATSSTSTGRRMYNAVVAGGAKAAGRKSGKLAPGKIADLLALNTNSHHLLGLNGDTLLDSFIFAGDDRLITDVWSAGRHMVREGKHIHNQRITSKYKNTVSKLRQSI